MFKFIEKILHHLFDDETPKKEEPKLITSSNPPAYEIAMKKKLEKEHRQEEFIKKNIFQLIDNHVNSGYMQLVLKNYYYDNMYVYSNETYDDKIVNLFPMLESQGFKCSVVKHLDNQLQVNCNDGTIKTVERQEFIISWDK